MLARTSADVTVVASASVCLGAGLPAVIATMITQAQRTAPAGATARTVGAVTSVVFVPHALGLVAGSLLVEQLPYRLFLVLLAVAVAAVTAVLHPTRGVPTAR